MMSINVGWVFAPVDRSFLKFQMAPRTIQATEASVRRTSATVLTSITGIRFQYVFYHGGSDTLNLGRACGLTLRFLRTTLEPFDRETGNIDASGIIGHERRRGIWVTRMTGRRGGHNWPIGWRG